MIRRLVQNEKICRFQSQHEHGQTAFFPAAEHRHAFETSSPRKRGAAEKSSQLRNEGRERRSLQFLESPTAQL